MAWHLNSALVIGAGVMFATIAVIDAEADTPAQTSSMIETVVVTATKRATSIQEVPFSINAVNGSRLQQLNILDLSSLDKIAPEIQPAPSPTNTVIAIRGAFNSNDAAGADHSVGIDIDDVPAAGSGDASLNQGFFDLDRIEILRGPQGTLFGRNVTGGLISLHSKEPSFDTSANIEAGYGNYGAYQAQGYVTGALTDDLAGRLSLSSTGDNGFKQNLELGEAQGREDNFAGRAQLLWTPSGDVKILGELEGVHNSAQNAAQIFGNFQPNAAQPLLVPITSGPWGPAGVYPDLAYGRDALKAPFNGFIRTNNLAGTIRADWDSGEWGTLTSITGYRTVNIIYLNDGDFTPFANSTVGERENERQFSEELRITSPADQRFRYVVGLFYLNSDRNLRLNVPLNYSMFAPLSLTNTPTLGYLFETGAFLEGLGVVTQFPGSTDQQNQRVGLNSDAIYGEFNYDITDKLTATIGGRYTRDVRGGTAFKSYNYAGVVQGSGATPGTEIGLTPANTSRIAEAAPACTTNPDGLGCFPVGTQPLTPIIATNVLPLGTRAAYPAFAGGPGISAAFHHAWPAFTPKFSLDYKPEQGLMFYATVARGFTAGGFSQRGSNGLSLETPFNPEYVWNYETGMKGTFFDGRLVTNVSLYRMNYKDLQVFIYDVSCSCVSVQNAAQAHSQGVELEAVGKPVDWLTLGSNWAYTEAVYDHYIAPSPTGGAPTNNSGNTMLNTPKNAINLYADISWPVAGLGLIDFDANIAFAGKRFFNDDNSDPAYIHNLTSKDGILDLDVHWTSDDGHWGAMVWGKNVTDRRYLVSALNGLAPVYTAISPALPTGADIATAGWNLPATFGATVSYTFE